MSESLIPGVEGGSPRSWLGGDDDLGMRWMQGCRKGSEPLTPTFPIFLSGSPFPPLLCPLNTEQTVELPSSPERPGASSDGRVALPTGLMGTAHTNSCTGHTTLLLNPSTPKVVARVQPSLSHSRTTLPPPTWAFPVSLTAWLCSGLGQEGASQTESLPTSAPSTRPCPFHPMCLCPAPSPSVAPPIHCWDPGWALARPCSQLPSALPTGCQPRSPGVCHGSMDGTWAHVTRDPATCARVSRLQPLTGLYRQCQ